LGAGGGGGYISCILTVVPSALINFTIAAGGVYGTSSSYGIVGGSTSFSYGGYSYSATEGQGGYFGDPFSQNITTAAVSNGGIFSSSAPGNFIGFNGQPGGFSRLKFMQTGSSEFARVVEYADGGDAAILPGSGAKGGYRLSSATYLQTIYAVQQAPLPGGGGSADYGYGWSGKGGRVIIHY
jgi:hypothetical protein